ncbi:hypothetical protein CO614_00800 [Lysobacteraceae bacterium NML120232]|nr:hypothetical protein CO608_09390 [Xanthomonadaceae bacterium NML08-0793]PJK13590.1 hypothetical protein CO614_00800 [Xanthomonadaceae bacterium NML120232]
MQMRPPIPPETPAGAGLLPRSTAWCVDALLLSLPVILISVALPGVRNAGVRQHWRALGEVMGRQMELTIQRGGDFFAYLQDVWAADGLARGAIADLQQALMQGIGIPLLLFVLLALLYWPLLEAGRCQATFGKRLLGLRVCDGSARARITYAAAFKRHLAGSLSWLSLNIGHLMMAAGEHRALHDRLADTRVVWAEGAARRTPWWGGLLILLVCASPLLLGVLAAAELSAAMASVIVG